MKLAADVSGVVLETERLVLREWREADLADFHEYASVDGVGEMAGWKRHTSVEQSGRVLRDFVENKNVFAIVHKIDEKVIGSLGVHNSWAKSEEQYKGMNVKEIGYVLSKDYWGRGLMVEAAAAVINWLFGLGFDAVTCSHFVSNNQSKRVIEKCGFKFVKNGTFFAKGVGRHFDDMRYILVR